MKRIRYALPLLTCLALTAGERLVFSSNFTQGYVPGTCIQPCSISSHEVKIVDIGNGEKALRFGNKRSAIPGHLLYRLKDPSNPTGLPEDQQPFPMHFGKLKFRFRPVGWSLQDPEYNMLLRLEGPLGTVLHLIYIRPNGVPSVQAAYGQFRNPHVEKGRISVIYPYARLDQNREWHDVALDWRPDKLTLSVDGNTVIQPTTTLSYPRKSFHAEQLWIGYYSPGLLRGETDMTGLKIWSTLPDAPKTEDHPRFPRLLVNVMSPPVIDGDISDTEWKDVSCYTGFLKLPSGSVGGHQPKVRIGHDQRAIYIALRSQGHRRAPVADKTKHDEAVWEDDSIEFLVGSPARPGEYYQFIVNHAGVVYDIHHVPGKSSLEEISWNSPGIRTASRIEEDAWNMEIAVPFEDLEVSAPVPGDELYFNICETIRGTGYFSLAAIHSSYAEYANFGILRFAGKGSPVIDFAELGDLHKGTPKFRCGIRGGSAARLEVDARRFDATAKAEFHLFGRTADISDKTGVCFQASKDELGKNGLLYSNVVQDGRRLYAGRFFYEIVQKVEIENMRRIIKDHGNRLRVTTTHLDDGQSRIRFLVRDSRNEISLQTTVPMTDMKQSTLLDIDSLPVGDYQVEALLLDKHGDVYQKAVPRGFTVYGKVPPWHDFIKKHIRADHVPAPWSPLEIQRKDNRIHISCWNRTYIFGDDSLFAEQFVSGGTSYLATPVGLLIRQDNAESPVRRIRTRLVSADARHATVEATGVFARNGTVTVQADVDYDGFVWYQMDFRAAVDSTLEKLAVQLKMPAACSTLLASGYRNLQDTGLTPRNWGKSLEGDSGPFWIGAENGGLSFGIESAENWHNGNHARQAELHGDNRLTSLKLNLVDIPMKTKRPLSYGFYIMPTPVRPRPRNYRRLRGQNWFGHVSCMRDGTGYPSNLSWWTATWHFQGYPEWETRQESLDRMYKVAPGIGLDRKVHTFHGMDRKMNRSAWYAAYSSVGRNAPEVIWNGEMWHAGLLERTYGNTIYSYEEDMIEVCKTRDYCDFYLWRFDRTRRENPAVDGLYFDLWSPPPCNRPDHAHGYVDENGIRKSVYPLREHRKWMELVYIYCKEHADGAPIVTHVSGATAHVAGYSHADFLLDGELWFDVLARDRSYKAMTLAQARAEILPQIWGPGVIWLSELHRAKGHVPVHLRKDWKLAPWAFRHFSGLLLIHDVIPDRTSLFETARKVWLALDHFGLADEDRMLPYWESCGITGDNDGQKTAITAFLKPSENRMMLVLFNNQDRQIDFRVDLDLQRIFGVQGVIRVRDLESEIALPIYERNFTVPVDMRNFRLLEVTFHP